MRAAGDATERALRTGCPRCFEGLEQCTSRGVKRFSDGPEIRRWRSGTLKSESRAATGETGHCLSRHRGLVFPLAPAADGAGRAAAGYEVHVATRREGRGAEIEAHGFTLHPLDWQRGSFNPLDRCRRSCGRCATLYRQLKPDLVHHVALAAVDRRLAGRARAAVPAIECAGGPRFRFHLAHVEGAGCSAGSVRRCCAFCSSDPQLGGAGAKSGRPRGDARRSASQRSAISSDSGLRRRYRSLEAAAGAGRRRSPPALSAGLLDDKGVRTLVDAHDLLTQRWRTVRLLIAGDRDPANPASIPARRNRKLERARPASRCSAM